VWFWRILAIVDAPRTRLELARSLAADGRNDEARQQFAAILQGSPPAQIRSWVTAELAALGAGETTATTVLIWRVGVGALRDSNANVGPRDATVSIFGLPFQLDDQSLGSSDTGVTDWVGVERHQVTPWGVLSLNARFDGTQYEHLTALSYHSMVAQGSLRQGYGSSVVTWSLGAQTVRQHSGTGRDGLFAAGSATAALGPDWSATAAATLGHNKLLRSIDGSSQLASSEFSLQRAFADGHRFSSGLRASRERFSADDLSHDNLSWYTLVEGPFSLFCPSCGWSMSGTMTRSRYGAEDPLFQAVRRDRQVEASFGMKGPTPRLSFEGVAAAWFVTFERSVMESTLALHRYQRTRVLVSQEWTF